MLKPETISLNRNILECKWDGKRDLSIYEGGLNRNILECKYWLYLPSLLTRRVLIETYWNVNMYGRAERDSPLDCLNRNILECKSSRLTNSIKNIAGLNRNILECKFICTYSGGKDSDVSLNRNILECKCYIYIDIPAHFG